ncbi:MAG: helix-turn-helix domain-containing protein [Acidobacteria bacterium]|nr:helix-turn-helix domain-containing protein [Acidobacteriota bacterium]
MAGTLDRHFFVASDVTPDRIRPVPEEGPKDFGSRLRQERERRGIPLREIAKATKISVSSLEALERNQVSRLPGGVFTRAFVRSYAVQIGLDPDRTMREFLDAFPEVQRPETADSIGHDVAVQRWSGWRMLLGAVILLALIAVKFYFW